MMLQLSLSRAVPGCGELAHAARLFPKPESRSIGTVLSLMLKGYRGRAATPR